MKFSEHGPALSSATVQMAGDTDIKATVSTVEKVLVLPNPAGGGPPMWMPIPVPQRIAHQVQCSV